MANISRRGFLKLSLAAPPILAGADAKKHQTPPRQRVFGITYHPDMRFEPQTGFDQEQILKDLRLIQRSGVNFIRTDTTLGRTAASSEKCLVFDRWFAEQAGKMGLELLFIVKNRAQLDACVPNLKDLVTYWQLGNEPNNRIFTDEWIGKDITLQDVIGWYKDNATRLKELHPRARIVLNPNDLPAVVTWYASWTNFYEAIEAAHVPYDIIGVDSYPGGAYQGGFPSEIKRTGLTAKKLGKKYNKPAWLVETGAPVFGRSERALR